MAETELERAERQMTEAREKLKAARKRDREKNRRDEQKRRQIIGTVITEHADYDLRSRVETLLQEHADPADYPLWPNLWPDIFTDDTPSQNKPATNAGEQALVDLRQTARDSAEG